MSKSTITAGTFLKNGGNRYFMVTEITESSIAFLEYTAHGATTNRSRMNRTVFEALYKNKNYAIVKFIYSLKQERWIEKTDRILDRSIGANRYLIKQY